MKSKKIFVLGLTVIILLSLSNSVLADSGLSYTVKPGDSRTYKITKDQPPGQTNPTTYQQTFQDGTSANVSIQEGLVFTLTICYVIGTGTSAIVYTKATINGKTSSCSLSPNALATLQNYQYFIPLESIVSPYTLPVMPTTTNLTYFNNLAPQTISVSSYPIENVFTTRYTLQGNNLLINTTGDIYRCFLNICFKNSATKIALKSEINVDVQTGWYKDISATETFENGTIYTQYAASQYSTTGSGGLPGFEISSALLSVFIAVPIVLIKRKRNKEM